jgi:hypothetical protein
LLKKLAISSLVFLLGLCLSELGLRGWQRWLGAPYDSARVERRLKDAVNPIAAFVPRLERPKLHDADGKPIGVLHPFTGSEDEHDTGGVLAYFREGVPEHVYTVVIVGGSVAGMFVNYAGGAFEQALARDPRLADRRVRVLNYTHAAYKEPQQLMRLAYLFSLGYRPDAVINIDGFNEVALAYENATVGTNPLYPAFTVWGYHVQDFGALSTEQLDLTFELWQLRNRARELVDGALRWKLYKSSLAGRFIESRLGALMQRRFLVQSRLIERATGADAGSSLKPQLNGPDFVRDPAQVFELCARNWFESSLSIQALCNTRGIAYLHVLQPTLHDPGSKLLSPEEQKLEPGPAPWRPGVVRGYPLLRVRAKELEQRGVHFMDASRVFADVHETLYVDACHLGVPGNQILAQAIAPFFLEHALDGNAANGLRDAQAPVEVR